MDKLLQLLEKITMTSGVMFAFSLFFMLLRMKLSKQFEMRDHVSSSFSFDLDFKVLKEIRKTYQLHYSQVVPSINYWSFILMVVGMLLLATLPILTFLNIGR